MTAPFQSGAISRLPENGDARPFWSVMIPTYNPKPEYLEITLQSVLDQAPGEERMQIEVVDDCSPYGAPEELVNRVGKGRIQLFRLPANQGLAGAWNSCITRSRGTWVHILHQDDYVLPGFYEKLEKVAKSQPRVALIGTRSFYVDEDGVITGVSQRLRELEASGTTVDSFFQGSHLQCPGVAVRRSFYEAHGGFLRDLVFVVDCEMWARAIASEGGVVTPEVLSCYRIASSNESGRLARTGETLRDFERLNRLFAKRYPTFNLQAAMRNVCYMALEQADQFKKKGDEEAATASLDFWRASASWQMRLRRFTGFLLRNIVGERMARRVLRNGGA